MEVYISRSSVQPAKFAPEGDSVGRGDGGTTQLEVSACRDVTTSRHSTSPPDICRTPAVNNSTPFFQVLYDFLPLSAPGNLHIFRVYMLGRRGVLRGGRQISLMATVSHFGRGKQRAPSEGDTNQSRKSTPDNLSTNIP